MTPQYKKCQTAEADIGMSYYLTNVDGTNGRLKAEPEDFIVKEISDKPEAKENGKFVIGEVTCRNWETNRLVRLLSRSLGISREKVGFAGTKDKRAITTQLMSFECPMSSMDRINLKDIEIRNLYTARRGIQIGDLIGNSFVITVKEYDTPKVSVQETLEIVTKSVKDVGGFPNYFGVQRFGVVRPITHKVGEFIVRGDFREAVKCYLSAPSPYEDVEIISARERLARMEDWSELLKTTPETLSFERIMVEHLISEPEDWAGALGRLPRNLQMMFVHAYQSYLFNLMLSKRMEQDLPLNIPVAGDVVIPLDSNKIPQHENPIVANAGNVDLVARQVRSGRAFITLPLYGSENDIDVEMSEIEMSVIEAENISRKDFIIPELPQCSSKGSRREILCPVSDLSHTINDDSYEVSFSLPKGNYATCLMREFMKSEMNRY